MRHRSPDLSRGGLITTLSLALLVTPLAAPAAARSQTLYTLNTRCSLQGAPAVPCTVEVINEAGVTLYRHRLGTQVETIRISDRPVRMAQWDHAGKRWRALQNASARFSSNTVCFNGADLCVVNPNYLNSVREENAAATAGRDLVKVHFGADGRIDASCYDNGCEVSLR